nr:acetyl-CoA carboxylase beta subunit [Tetraena hamiensis var. qatarensis]
MHENPGAGNPIDHNRICNPNSENPIDEMQIFSWDFENQLFEIYKDQLSCGLSELKKALSSYFHSNDLNKGSKSENLQYDSDNDETQSSYWNDYINRCINNYLRSQTCLDSSILIGNEKVLLNMKNILDYILHQVDPNTLWLACESSNIQTSMNGNDFQNNQNLDINKSSIEYEKYSCLHSSSSRSQYFVACMRKCRVFCSNLYEIFYVTTGCLWTLWISYANAYFRYKRTFVWSRYFYSYVCRHVLSGPAKIYFRGRTLYRSSLFYSNIYGNIWGCSNRYRSIIRYSRINWGYGFWVYMRYYGIRIRRENYSFAWVCWRYIFTSYSCLCFRRSSDARRKSQLNANGYNIFCFIWLSRKYKVILCIHSGITYYRRGAGEFWYVGGYHYCRTYCLHCICGYKRNRRNIITGNPWRFTRSWTFISWRRLIWPIITALSFITCSYWIISTSQLFSFI